MLGGHLPSSGSKISARQSGGSPDGVRALLLGGRASTRNRGSAALAHTPVEGFVAVVSCLDIFGGTASEINQQVMEGFQDRTQNEACACVQGPLVFPALAHVAGGTAGVADKVWSRSADTRGRTDNRGQ